MSVLIRCGALGLSAQPRLYALSFSPSVSSSSSCAFASLLLVLLLVSYPFILPLACCDPLPQTDTQTESTDTIPPRLALLAASSFHLHHDQPSSPHTSALVETSFPLLFHLASILCRVALSTLSSTPSSILADLLNASASLLPSATLSTSLFWCPHPLLQKLPSACIPASASPGLTCSTIAYALQSPSSLYESVPSRLCKSLAFQVSFASASV